LGEDLDQLPKQVEKLFTMPYRLEKAKPISALHRKALAHYQEKRGMIEASVWEQVKTHNGNQALVSHWNQELAANIRAALTLDDIALLRDEISWGKDLLVHHDLPETTLSHYLKAYQQAARVYLDERGQPIMEGLAQINQ
jgi:hypothetical protein